MISDASSKPVAPDGVDLYWVPLGAGNGVGAAAVRAGGRTYRTFAALRGKDAGPVFHAALVIWLAGQPHSLEMAPAWGPGAGGASVVATGPVGLRALGRWPAFRYEVRCPPGLTIPDLAYAVESPVRDANGSAMARRVLDEVVKAPRRTWGRDELRVGEMWNSNALVAWLLTSVGIDVVGAGPPRHGVAPGWAAGIRVACDWGVGVGLPGFEPGTSSLSGKRSNQPEL